MSEPTVEQLFELIKNVGRIEEKLNVKDMENETLRTELAEREAEIERLRGALDRLIEESGDWWPDGYEHYPDMQKPILLVGEWFGDRERILSYLLRGE